MHTKWNPSVLIILTVMIFGLSYGLSAPLIAIRLSAAGHSELYVGINAAMQALGVFAVAPFLPLLCRHLSPKKLLAFSLVAMVVLLALFPFAPIESWFALRLGLGVFSEIIMVVSETWLNRTTVEQATIGGVLECVHPKDRERLRHYWSAARRRSSACSIAFRITGSDDAIRYIRDQTPSILTGSSG